MEPSDALHAFRYSLYDCSHRRGDALFELTDAILVAGAVPSPVHLSLEAPHRCGWGSLYAALNQGRIDAQALRGLLARHPLAGSQTPVFAVNVWPRCDAESSPEPGFYHHPSRHSAGQPIVAGWAYQFIARLNFLRESWSAPVDVERVRPARDANEVAAEQVKAFVCRSPEEDTLPCSSSTPATIPSSRCSRGWRGTRARSSSVCGQGVASTPSLAGAPATTGRPRRHGPKMKCADPHSTWPEPSTE